MTRTARSHGRTTIPAQAEPKRADRTAATTTSTTTPTVTTRPQSDAFATSSAKAELPSDALKPGADGGGSALVSARFWQPPQATAPATARPAAEQKSIDQALGKLDDLGQKIEAAIAGVANFDALVKQSAPKNWDAFVAHADQGASLPPELALPGDKLAWIQQVLGEVEHATGLDLPADIVFSYVNRGSSHPGACMNSMHVGDRTIEAMQFDDFELSFAYEIVGHEAAHRLFDDALEAASPLFARLAALKTKYNALGDAYKHDASIRPALMELEKRGTELGFSVYKLSAQTPLLHAHGELFADLMVCIARQDPDAISKALSMTGGGSDPQLRSFSHDVAAGAPVPRSNHVDLASVRKELWEIKQRYFVGRDPEFVQGVVKAFTRSCERTFAAEHDQSWDVMQDPAGAARVLRECIREELVPAADRGNS